MPDNRRYLVIGNGFDLAHGLPTKYQDMLSALKTAYKQLYQITPCSDPPRWITGDQCDKYWANPLIQYFLLQTDLNGWTDFERELAYILHEFLSAPPKESTFERPNGQTRFNTFYPVPLFKSENKLHAEKKISELLDLMKKHLDDLIEFINLYLSKYLPTIKITQIPSFLYRNLYHGIVSFNYTFTYHCIVEIIKLKTEPTINFIHGHSSVDHNSSPNIVLGIEDDEPNDLRTVYFKKYFQRIQKKTQRFYRTWYEPPRKDIYCLTDFYGHSLDLSDKDILLYILNHSKQTRIFFLDQKDYEEKIINLIQILDSPEEFERRYYSEEIVFKPIPKPDSLDRFIPCE